MKGPVRNELSYFANYFAFGPVLPRVLTNRASAGRTPARSSAPLPHAHVPPYAKCRLGFPTYARTRTWVPRTGQVHPSLGTHVPVPHNGACRADPRSTPRVHGTARRRPYRPTSRGKGVPYPRAPRTSPISSRYQAPPLQARSTHPVPDGPARYPSPAPRTGYARAWRHIGSHGHAAFLPHVGSRGHAVPTPRGSLFRRLGAPAAGAVPYEVGGRFPRWVC